jgi:hypothetical protein
MDLKCWNTKQRNLGRFGINRQAFIFFVNFRKI